MAYPIVTLALVGAGRWGTNIRRTLERLPGCRLRHVETHRWERLLRVPDLDGVLIATPASTHYPIARAFIARGVPTFIEKPLTTSLRDARALQVLARRKRITVLAGHVHLHNPAYRTVKRLLPRLGRIRAILGEGAGNGPFRDDISVLWDWAPHDLSMCLDLLGREPLSVSAWAASVLRPKTRLYDIAALHLTFPGGTVATITSSWLSPVKKRSLTVFGENSTLVFDDTAEKKVTLYRGLGPTRERRNIVRHEPAVSFPPYGDQPPLEEELRAFLDCLRAGSRPAADLDHGVAVIRILDAAERSLARGGVHVS